VLADLVGLHVAEIRRQEPQLTWSLSRIRNAAG
jgi:hypothetical protein